MDFAATYGFDSPAAMEWLIAISRRIDLKQFVNYKTPANANSFAAERFASYTRWDRAVDED